MQHAKIHKKTLSDVTSSEIIELFKSLHNPEGATKKWLYLVGIILTPITMIGALWFFVRNYNRHLKQKEQQPTLSELEPITKVAMFIGGIVIWLTIIAVMYLSYTTFAFFFGKQSGIIPYVIGGINALICLFVFVIFRRWQNRVIEENNAKSLFGTARWALKKDLIDLLCVTGIYIGGQMYGYKKQGHLISISSTRGGKFVNLIAPNLLGLGGYPGSWFCIDVKGEISAVTARYQRSLGKKVIILNPWSDQPSDSYNPLDVLYLNKDNEEALIDAVSVIAEMIVPKKATGEQFWQNRARSVIGGLILYLVLSQQKEVANLGTIWKWLRLPEDMFEEILVNMSVSRNDVVRATGNECISAIKTSDKMWGSIMAEALDHTDFLKSPALQKSLSTSSFDITKINDGNTTLYQVIPPDKIESHAQWLRLVLSTSMLSVVKNKNKRITFLIDEFAALGYLPQAKVALSTYAGYNITLWPIVQELAQLKDIYGESWTSFISNTAVRHFFNISDNFGCEYVSQLIGEKTSVMYEDGKPKSTARRLITPDEVRRFSGENIITIIEQRPPTYFAKIPYYEMDFLNGRHDENPYYTPDEDDKPFIAPL